MCPFCGQKSTTEKLSVVSDIAEVENSNEGGYVKEATYIVTDNLNVIPLSTLSIINLLDEFYVENVKALEEKVIDLDNIKGVGAELLLTSLHSQATLSDVFLKPIVALVKEEVVLPVKEEKAKPAYDVSLGSDEYVSSTPDTKRKASVDLKDPTNEDLYKELQDSITKNDKHSFVEVIEKTQQRKSKRNCGPPKRLDL
ncbi:hypothetical protein FRX31_028685 [Thalictrum thalictroides]|uniref:Uncharacterized protein n=1 Tax=Thalictrum thalictroides TaxID=46969 RepID=A0A7J6VBY1_THATH|nr:hypothetical protein FRX31_028685 [Thalictrum thalictroides]